MRRFWLWILLLVMPLQMSWAAVHVCIDNPSGAGPATQAQDHVHAEAKAAGLDDSGATLHDTCCVSAHGCHGLHNLISPSEPFFARRLPVAKPEIREPLLLMATIAYRHERPNWPAA